MELPPPTSLFFIFFHIISLITSSLTWFNLSGRSAYSYSSCECVCIKKGWIKKESDQLENEKKRARQKGKARETLTEKEKWGPEEKKSGGSKNRKKAEQQHESGGTWTKAFILKPPPPSRLSLPSTLPLFPSPWSHEVLVLVLELELKQSTD